MSSHPFDAAVQSLSEDLSGVAALLAEKLETGDGIEAVEQPLWTAMIEAGRTIYAAILASQGDGDVGECFVIERDGRQTRYERRELERRPLRTIFGTIPITRFRYVSDEGDCLYPFDARLKTSQKSVSPLLQQWIVSMVSEGVYESTRNHLAMILGFEMSRRTLENVVSHRGEDAWDFCEQIQPEKAAPGKILVANFDGKGVTVRKTERTAKRKKLLPGQKPNKRKMATIATIHETDPIEHDVDLIAQMDEASNPSRARPESKLVFADLCDRKKVLALARRQIEARLSPGTLLVVGIDGCPKLEAGVRKALKGIDAPNVLYVLDWYHLSEYLWDALKSREKDADARYEVLARRILEGKVSSVVAGLKQSVTKRGGTGAGMVVKAIKYLEHHLHLLNYDRAIELGAPIATGAVEGACAHIVRSRMQRPGMRWSIPGAQAVLDLRCIAASKLDKQHHEWFRRREVERLHSWLTHAQKAA